MNETLEKSDTEDIEKLEEKPSFDYDAFKTKAEQLKTLDDVIRESDKMSMDLPILIEQYGQQRMLEPKDQNFISSHLGTYNENSGVIFYIDKQGHSWITRTSEEKRAILDKEGFKSSADLYVPFGANEEPAGPDRKRQWLDMESNMWRERYQSALDRDDKPGMKQAEDNINRLAQKEYELQNNQ